MLARQKKKHKAAAHSALCFNFDHELKREEVVGKKTKERPTITFGHPCKEANSTGGF